MFLYHYTSIENLALILKNRTIRFNRLDRVDDIEESSVYENNIPMGKYTFVSCWTDNEEESIPLWGLYTPKMRGVRIKMNASNLFFKYKHSPGIYNTSFGPISLNSELESYFPFEEQFNNRYHIISQGKDIKDFIRKVEYHPDYKKMSQDAIDYTITAGEPHIKVEAGKIGMYKSERWAFQEEVRFVLTIFPFEIDPVANQLKTVQLVQLGVEVPLLFYDLKLESTAFSNMEITIGPNCSDSDLIIIDSLIKNLNPTATIKQSKLRGSLRIR